MPLVIVGVVDNPLEVHEVDTFDGDIFQSIVLCSLGSLSVKLNELLGYVKEISTDKEVGSMNETVVSLFIRNVDMPQWILEHVSWIESRYTFI